MNILITGSNGFIGKHICDFLESQNYTLFKIVQSQKNENRNSFELDLKNANMVEAFLEEFKVKNKVDCIIHLASALVNTRQTKDEQYDVLIDNLEITRNMVKVISELGPRKVINFSSMAVYPNIDGVYTEESKVMMSDNHECMYGLSKFCSENIFDHMLKDKKISIVHLRVAQVYGDGMRDDRVISVMKSELIKNNEITVFGNGERISNFIHIENLIDVIKYFVSYDIIGIFNVGKESLSYYDLAKRIIADFGNEYSLIKKQENGSKAKFILNTKKIELLLVNVKS